MRRRGTALSSIQDACLRRVKKVASGTTTVYVFSGTQVIDEYQNGAAPSAPTREYIYSGGGLLAKIESGAVQYYHPDQLSVRLMTDSNGNVIGQQGHYPFGESWYQSSATTKWFFTAGVYPERSRRERDSESGNDYATFRYDVNRLGRFASPDLLAGSIGDPQSLNRYAYVRNDPVNGVDPLGLTDCDPATQGQYAGCEPGDQTSGVPDSGVIFLSSVDLCISCVYGVLGATAALAPTFDPATVGGEWGGQDPYHGGVAGRIAKAKQIVKEVLEGNNDCSKFFDNSSPAVEARASDKGTPLEGLVPTTAADFFNSDTIEAAPLPEGVAATSHELAGANATIYVSSDPNSPFSSSGPSTGFTYFPATSSAGGVVVPGTGEFDALTLLHEFGHTVGALLPDAGDQAKSQANDTKVLDNCLKAIQAAVNGS